MTRNAETDASGNPILGDIGLFLADNLKAHFKRESSPIDLKYIDPTYMVRAIPTIPNDRVYCNVLGQNSVHAAFAGFTGTLVLASCPFYNPAVPAEETLVRRGHTFLCSRDCKHSNVHSDFKHGIGHKMHDQVGCPRHVKPCAACRHHDWHDQLALCAVAHPRGHLRYASCQHKWPQVEPLDLVHHAA